MIGKATILTGDAATVLKDMDASSIHCAITSPPYWGLRDYGVDGQLGQEETPEEYVEKMVGIFREVRRVLRDDGTLWLNLGDSYAGSRCNSGNKPENTSAKQLTQIHSMNSEPRPVPTGLKTKDLIGIPWRVALALQADGWYLRQDIIWHKPNPMPESVTDRCTKAHEYIFLLSKSPRYYYDHEAIKEESVGQPPKRMGGNKYGDSNETETRTKSGNTYTDNGKRNKRSVWTVSAKPYSEAHFATFPPELIEPCILAGCPVDGTVLDPFLGSGTTALEAVWNGRNAIGIELNEEYVKLAERRIGRGLRPSTYHDDSIEPEGACLFHD